MAAARSSLPLARPSLTPVLLPCVACAAPKPPPPTDDSYRSKLPSINRGSEYEAEEADDEKGPLEKLVFRITCVRTHARPACASSTWRSKDMGSPRAPPPPPYVHTHTRPVCLYTRLSKGAHTTHARTPPPPPGGAGAARPDRDLHQHARLPGCEAHHPPVHRGRMRGTTEIGVVGSRGSSF